MNLNYVTKQKLSDHKFASPELYFSIAHNSFVSPDSNLLTRILAFRRLLASADATKCYVVVLAFRCSHPFVKFMARGRF